MQKGNWNGATPLGLIVAEATKKGGIGMGGNGSGIIMMLMLVLVVVMSSAVSAANATISVSVKDLSNGSVPLAGVNVTIVNITGITNGNGTVEFVLNVTGQITVTAQKADYGNASVIRVIPDGNSYTLVNLQMVRCGYAYYRDTDDDGYGITPPPMFCETTPPVGYSNVSGDCNDNNALIHPGVPETCNNIDDDCDGSADEGLTLYTYYQNFDSDTYGNVSNGITTCNATPPTGYVNVSGDCNDHNVTIHPGATEVCGNSIDDDCDGLIDENCQWERCNPAYWNNGIDEDGDGNMTIVDLNIANATCSTGVLLGNPTICNLSIANNGNVPLKDVYVSSPDLGQSITILIVNPGESIFMSWNKVFPTTGTVKIRFYSVARVDLC